MAGKVLRSKDVLMRKTVKELKELAKGYFVSGTGRMRKEELAEAVASAIMEPARLSEALYMIHPTEKQFVMAAAAADGPIPVPAEARTCARIFSDLGYLAYDRESDTAEMPVETIAVLAVLEKEGYWTKVERADLLFNYCQAAVNLYGAIPQVELIEIFNRQNEKKTDRSEMFQVQLRHLTLDAAFCTWRDYLVSVSFEEDNFAELPELLSDIARIPRYIPERDTFLRYADERYYEKTLHTARLTTALQEVYQLTSEQAKSVVQDVVISIQSLVTIPNVLRMLTARGIVITENLMPEFIRVLTAIQRTTRMWTQKGHTLEELEQMRKGWKTGTGPRGVQPGQKPKIGRNDPCPCGSGKKYKRCCGR